MSHSPKSEDCDEEIEHHEEAEDFEVNSDLAAEATFNLLHGSVPNIAVVEGLPIPTARLLEEDHREEFTIAERCGAVCAEMRPSIDTSEQSSTNRPLGGQRLRH